MIRINLLPQKRRRVDSGGGGEAWVLIAVALLLVEIGGLFVFHNTKEAELLVEKKKNQQVQAKIDASKEAVTNHKNVTAELEAMRAREDAIAKLQSARTGPTAVLLETARILTPGRGPSIDPEKLLQIRRDNPLAAYNPTWDTRRLWVHKHSSGGINTLNEGDQAQLIDSVLLKNHFSLRTHLTTRFIDENLRIVAERITTSLRLDEGSFLEVHGRRKAKRLFLRLFIAFLTALSCLVLSTRPLTIRHGNLILTAADKKRTNQKEV